jgi:UDP-glucose 4-epimerase
MSNKGKVLVTGGTGFIGQHTVAELIESGYEVIILDNLANSKKSVLDQIEKVTGVKPSFYQIDLVNKTDVLNFFDQIGHLEGVIHFAALKAVGESVQQPLMYYQNNLIGLLNLLEGMRNSYNQKLVFSSSCTVYGQPEVLPVTEKSPKIRPESPYGNTKSISEEIIEDVSKVTDLTSINLRYFNPIGAHPTALLGEEPIGNPNNVMPVITQTAIGKRDSMTVFGNDYSTPDGTCIRDYIHVVDLAKAHVIALERILSNKCTSKTEYFNLGTGNGFSVLQLINAFESNTGVKLDYKIGPRREGDVVSIYADTSLANEVLGWTAQLGIDDMVLSAWKWELYLKGINS